MKDVARELREIVSDFSKKIGNLPDAEFSAKPLPHKWSKKEVVGHLIDSAQNNLRRFITTQYETEPPQISYQQDFWVSANRYRDTDRHDIVTLWKLTNFQICTVLESMPPEHFSKQCNTGNALRTLEWLAADYVKHLKHHLNQIISGSFDVVYVS